MRNRQTMKLTKREKEIVTALRDGARLWPPDFLSHQWEIRGPLTLAIGQWVYDTTIQKMKKSGVLDREITESRVWLVPSLIALQVLEADKKTEPVIRGIEAGQEVVAAIPARPFLKPTIEAHTPEVVKKMSGTLAHSVRLDELARSLTVCTLSHGSRDETRMVGCFRAILDRFGVKAKSQKTPARSQWSELRVCSLGCGNSIINRNKSGICTYCWNYRPDDAAFEWARRKA